MKPQVLTRHFPTLLNMLLDLLANHAEQIARAAFIAFIDVIDAYDYVATLIS